MFRRIWPPHVVLYKKALSSTIYPITVSLPLITSASSARYLSQNRAIGTCTSQHIETKVKGSENGNEFKNKIATIPNALCLFRIGLTPVIGHLIIKESHMTALALFAVTGITDWLDGYIARNVRNQSSLIGSIIDPVADKLLITTIFVTLTYVKLVPRNFSYVILSRIDFDNVCAFFITYNLSLYNIAFTNSLTLVALTVLVILRDVGLIIGAAVARYKTMEKPITLVRYFSPSISPYQITPTFVSKVNTALQMCVIAGSLVAPLSGFTSHPFLTCTYLATAATTIYSGFQYTQLTGMKPLKKG